MKCAGKLRKFLMMGNKKDKDKIQIRENKTREIRK